MLEIVGQDEAAVFVLGVCVIVNAFTIGVFIHGAIAQITQHLGIKCLTLGRRDQGKQLK